TLRAVLAIRWDFLAQVEPLVEAVPRDLPFARFPLRQLGRDGALEAVVGPAARYAEFAPGVAEAIVRQLNTIRVSGFDGRVASGLGEHIEMVHLQIVCDRLWRSLPEGVTRVDMAHVERAAGEGQQFA